MTKILGALGLVVNLAGVLILFRYGMPYRVETGGAIHRIAEGMNPSEKRKDALYKRLGILGIALAVLGILLQIVATLTT